MTIEQTVEIPASHRLTIDVPREIPAGPVVLTFRPTAVAKADKALAIEDVRRRLQEEMSAQGTSGVYAASGDGWTAHVRERHAEP